MVTIMFYFIIFLIDIVLKSPVQDVLYFLEEKTNSIFWLLFFYL